MTTFADPVNSLGRVEPGHLAALLAGSHDIALVLDRQGTITDIAVGNPTLTALGTEAWRGRALSETVTAESRAKIQAMLVNDSEAGPPRWRQVNHPLPPGADLPVMYYAWPLPSTDHVLVLGRELQSVAELQRRLVEAQQAMENDYAKMRQTEARYRVLFQLSGEAFVITDARTGSIVEANEVAGEMLGADGRDLQRAKFVDRFQSPAAAVIERLLAGVQATGRGDQVVVVAASGRQLVVRARLFRQHDTPLFLINLHPPEGSVQAPSPLLSAVEHVPDAFVVTDPTGRVMAANDAFLDLVHLATFDQAKDRSLDEWLARPGIDINVMMSNLNERGTLKLFQTKVESSVGSEIEAEISAVRLQHQGDARLAFVIRDVSRRLPSEAGVPKVLTRSIDQLTELVGRVSLKDLVRETTDMIERLYIEAALQMTGDNRASAAEVLGLSRQSLYVKLRRYGLLDAETDDRVP